MGKKRGKGRVASRLKDFKGSVSSKKHNIQHAKSNHNKGKKQETLAHRLGFTEKQELPMGIKILAIYTLLLSLVYLLAALISPTAIVFGRMIPGALGKAVNFIYVFILLTLVFGFITRKKWVWKFSMVWYGYAMLDAIVSGFSINSYFDLLMNIIIAFLFFTFIGNAVMLWYVHNKRTYFLGIRIQEFQKRIGFLSQ